MNTPSKCLHSHWLIALVIASLLLPACHKATEPDDLGIFHDKIAYVTKAQVGSRMVSVADLYEEAGSYSLQNIRSVVEGSGPHFSRDRSWIAFTLVSNGITAMRVNVDGTGLSAISFDTTVVPQSVKISPQGDVIAVTIGDFYEQTIGLIPAKGGHFQMLVSNPSSPSHWWAMQPDWSHDGNTLYFTWVDFQNRFGHASGGLAKAYIARISRSGGGSFTFVSDTTSAETSDSEPALSPDGRVIAFTSQRSHPGEIIPEVFSMNIDGTNVQRLVPGIPGVRQGDHYDKYTMDSAPHWTKDGALIYFERQTYTYDSTISNYRDITDIYCVRPDGSNLQNLTKTGSTALLKTAEPR